jgi:hypothetical protein
MHAGLSDPVAYLLTALGALLIPGILIWVGVKRLTSDTLKPSMTIEQVQRDRQAAKEMVR